MDPQIEGASVRRAIDGNRRIALRKGFGNAVRFDLRGSMCEMFSLLYGND